METDVAFKLTSGDEGRATSSRRQAIMKVALAGDAGKLPQGVVMHVLREYVHKRLGRVGMVDFANSPDGTARHWADGTLT